MINDDGLNDGGEVLHEKRCGTVSLRTRPGWTGKKINEPCLLSFLLSTSLTCRSASKHSPTLMQTINMLLFCRTTGFVKFLSVAHMTTASVVVFFLEGGGGRGRGGEF